ncbi:MAG: HlyD family efflux transporter periplasmic adaptor subunit [Planctomycetaceae bacterium]
MANVDLQQLAVDRSGSARTKPRARRHVTTRYVLPALLLLGFGGLATWAARDFLIPPAPVKVIPVFASRSEVQREGTPLFKAAGWVEPRPTPTRVAALAPGVIERLLVVEDQAVKAGEPIAELVKEDARLTHERALVDVKLREAELEEVKAALAAAKTRFEQPVHLEAPLSEAESALAQIETQLKNLPHETRRADARLALAERDFQGKSAAKGVVSGLALEQARSEFDTATALIEELRDRAGSLQAEKSALVHRRDALKKQLELLADEIKMSGESGAKVAAAAARLEQARLVVAEAKLRLDRMTVRAPIDGRVYRLVGQPGTTLSGGMGVFDNYDGSTVITLYRPEMLQVRVDVRFEDIPQVSLKQPVQIENPALKEPLRGTVLFVSSLANIQKNTLEVKVAIDNPPAVFKPEMLVDVTFLAPPEAAQPSGPSEEMRLYVLREHIHQDERGAFVWVADQSAGVARRTPVQTNAKATGNGLVEIESGLTISSRIIVVGFEDLSDGDRIRVIGEAQDAAASAAMHANAGPDSEKHIPNGGTH